MLCRATAARVRIAPACQSTSGQIHRYQAISGTVGSSLRTKLGMRLRVCAVWPGLAFLVVGDVWDVWDPERAAGGVEGEDGPTDRRGRDCWLSADPSNCQSMPCCFFNCAKFSLRASSSSFDLAIFSG